MGRSGLTSSGTGEGWEGTLCADISCAIVNPKFTSRLSLKCPLIFGGGGRRNDQIIPPLLLQSLSIGAVRGISGSLEV
jgi:hypothetical protein